MIPGTPAPATDPTPRIGDWLSEAFDLFGREWQTWVGQGLLYLLLALGPMMLGYGLLYATVLVGSIGAGAAANTGTSPAPPVGALIFGFGGLLAGMLVGFVFLYYLTAGMKRTAVKQLRGEPIAVRDIFSAGDVFWPYLGTNLLFGLIIVVVMLVGLVLCIVPGLVGGLLVGGMLMFAAPLVVEKRIGVTEALRESWDVTKPHMWMYAVWYLVITLIGSVGSYLCYIGMAATWPIYILGVMISYRDAIGIPGALPSPRAQALAVPYTGGYHGPAGPPVVGGRCPACGTAVAAGAVTCPNCRTTLNPGSGMPPSGPPAQ